MAKKSLLVTILSTNRGKSLVFIVLAMLLGSRVTIIIALYIKLKRQLVTRYINASLDYKY
jgi:superfamily II DNA helicase RecQ